MAVDVVPPSAPENKAAAAVRGIPSFYQAVMAEMRKVTWPELPDVRRATVAIIALIDVVLQQVLVRWIPGFFTGR